MLLTITIVRIIHFIVRLGTHLSIQNACEYYADFPIKFCHVTLSREDVFVPRSVCLAIFERFKGFWLNLLRRFCIYCVCVYNISLNHHFNSLLDLFRPGVSK